MKTLLDKFVCLSDNKPTYTSAGDHLKAAQDQNAVLQEKLLQLKLMIQQEEAPLMMTLGISTDEYQDQIQALEQQKEVLQKEIEELKRKRSEEAARGIDLKYLDAQKCELEGQCQHIQEVIQIHSEQYEVVYPEEIQEMKSLILFLKDEVEILLEEQKEVENSRPESKELQKESHQLMKDVEDLKKNNSDQKGELEELNLDLLERQQIPAKLEAIKKEQESLRKENSVLMEQISECRSKIQQTAVLNKPQRPAGNRCSFIPVLAKRLGQKKQVSTDAGATEQPTTVLKKPQSPAGNHCSRIPVIAKKPEPTKQVSTDAETTKPPKTEVNKPQSPAGNPSSPKRREVNMVVVVVGGGVILSSLHERWRQIFSRFLQETRTERREDQRREARGRPSRLRRVSGGKRAGLRHRRAAGSLASPEEGGKLTRFSRPRGCPSAASRALRCGNRRNGLRAGAASLTRLGGEFGPNRDQADPPVQRTEPPPADWSADSECHYRDCLPGGGGTRHPCGSGESSSGTGAHCGSPETVTPLYREGYRGVDSANYRSRHSGKPRRPPQLRRERRAPRFDAGQTRF
ncbi:hypothetical protein FQA47_001912 [Oryzias melastigma]|uniref:Uncharacterized protein n=1 Tax=Oryzias melastigma TaxID=30732 RepID=A0A834FH45_ORYME|nr:hypothetical protein FQA47_001912 [Oryzias melastigma]